MERMLRRFGAIAVGIISPLVIWWVWGQWNPVPVIHDEVSYVLQAEIFARGRWTVASPPLPEFFEQPHVQVEPAVASKYPPGHSLLLAPGALAGFPALVPLLLTGLTAALLFALAARVLNVWVALLAWSAWLFSSIVLRFQPTYLSEITTTPLVLASWWSLLRWRETRARNWLLATALLVGWGAITRPLTMLVFAIPIGIVVIADVARLRRWTDLGLAVVVGVALLAILPVWSARTTGDWRVSPITKYRLDYLPYDRIGFEVDTTPPRRRATMSKVLVETYDYFLLAHRQQTAAALPRTATQRILALGSSFFDGPRLVLLFVFVAGLFFLTPPLRFAAGSCLLLFLAYLPYAYWPGWTVYFLETAPVIAAITALGLWRVSERVGLLRGREQVVAGIATAAVALVGAFRAHEWRAEHQRTSLVHRQIAEAVKTLPQPGILFVRYSPRIPNNPAIVRNSAELSREPIWIVHDLGPHNADLLRAAPGRQPHALDIDRILQPSGR